MRVKCRLSVRLSSRRSPVETEHLGHQNVHFDKRSTELTPKSQSTFCVSPDEVTAIPDLLRLLTLNGCIITIDAMGCQPHIVETIIEAHEVYQTLNKNHGRVRHTSETVMPQIHTDKRG